MKGYQKLTIITSALGLILPLIGLSLYFLINAIIGIPILALFAGEALLLAIIIIAINVGAVVVAFKIKDKRIVGSSLIACGLLLFAVIQLFAIPALVLFIVAGILAFKDKEKPSNLSNTNKQDTITG